MGRFRFIGELGVGDNWLREGKTKAGKKYKSLNISIVAAKNNRAYAEMFGQEDSEIKTKDNDRNDITIAWKNRLDEDVIKEVSNKYVVKLGDDRHEFITPLDVIDYVQTNIDELKGKRVIVTGNTSKNIYNGKVTDRFQIRNFYFLSDEDETKNELKVFDIFYFNKESFDFADYKEEKKIYINGYTSEYIDKETGNKYLPMQGILDFSRVDFTNALHAGLADIRLTSLMAKRDGEKLTCTIKGSDYYKQSVEFNYTNGSEAIEFDESQLTSYQKQLLDLGLKKLEDFRPAGQAYGQRITVYKIYNFDARDDYADGAIFADKAKDFEEEIYTISTADESVSDLDKAMNPPEEKKADTSVADLEYDLFG